MIDASLRLTEGQRVQLAALFAKQRDGWAEVGEEDLAAWFAELVDGLCEATLEGRRQRRELDREFARVLGIEALPAAIVVGSRSEAGYPPDSAGRQSAQDACGYPVLSDDANPTPEES